VRSAIRSIAIAVFSSPVALAAPGLTVGHILDDGAIEPHATESRLLRTARATSSQLDRTSE